MAMFGAADRRSIADEFARDAATPEPLTFGEGVSAVMEDVGLTGRSDSLARQVQDSATRSLARLSALTGEQFDFPTYGWSDGQSLAAVGLLNSRADAIKALRSDPNGPPDPFLKTGDEIQQEATQRVQQARALASRAGLGAQIVGGIAGAATDPLNLALLPLGVARAETLAAKVIGEAVVGAVAGGAMEVASLPAKDFAGVTPTAGEAAANIGLNAAFGAGIGALTHGVELYARRRALVDAIDQGIAEGRIQPTRDITTARDAIQDHLDTVPAMATPEVEGAHLDATAAATDVLRAEHPIEQAAALQRLDEKAQRLASVATAEDIRIASMSVDEWLTSRPKADPGTDPTVDSVLFMTGVDSANGEPGVTRIDISAEQVVYVFRDENGAVRGALRGFLDESGNPDLASIAVGPEFQGQGIGKQLLAAARRDFPEADASLVQDTSGLTEAGARLRYRDAVAAVERAAVAREADITTPAFEPPPIDAPVTRSLPDPVVDEADAYFRSILEAEPDIEIAMDFDGVPAVGRAADIMADLDRQLAELGETTDCILGVVE